MDAWIERHKGLRYDEAGKLGGTGAGAPELLHSLLADTYFSHQSTQELRPRRIQHVPWLERHLDG
jgi:anhydro-N-acetylmuramic acid kinase